jgi:hypothetical protein
VREAAAVILAKARLGRSATELTGKFKDRGCAFTRSSMLGVTIGWLISVESSGVLSSLYLRYSCYQPLYVS